MLPTYSTPLPIPIVDTATALVAALVHMELRCAAHSLALSGQNGWGAAGPNLGAKVTVRQVSSE